MEVGVSEVPDGSLIADQGVNEDVVVRRLRPSPEAACLMQDGLVEVLVGAALLVRVGEDNLGPWACRVELGPLVGGVVAVTVGYSRPSLCGQLGSGHVGENPPELVGRQTSHGGDAGLCCST